MVQGRERGGQCRVGARALDRERTLAGGRDHHLGVEVLGDLGAAAEPVEAGRGQHHRVQLAGGHVADPGVHVAADRDGLQLGAAGGGPGVQLCHPAGRAGADPGRAAGAGELLHQLVQGQALGRDQRVPDVLALRDGGQHQALGGGGGQVLERVHGEVDPALQQRVAQRGDEHTGAADLRQRLAGGVAVGGDLDQLDGAPGEPGHLAGHHARLGHGEGAAPGAEPQGRGGRRLLRDRLTIHEVIVPVVLVGWLTVHLVPPAEGWGAPPTGVPDTACTAAGSRSNSSRRASA